MRSSTARSSRSSSSARRSRPTRQSKRARRPSQPLLTPRQAREVAGVLVILFGLLGVVAVVSTTGSALGGFRSFWRDGFGMAWPIPLLLILTVGFYLIWPEPPEPRRLDVAAAVISAVAVIGLVELAWGAGGRAGYSIDGVLTGLAGPVGAAIVLGAGLLLGLIVAFHFSLGSVLLGAGGVIRAGYAERKRLDGLVKPRSSPDLKPKVAVASAGVPAPPVRAPALKPELEPPDV